MLARNSSDNKHRFAYAYKSFSKIIVIVNAIILCMYELFAIMLVRNTRYYLGLISLGMVLAACAYLISVFFAFHFSRVISSYVKEGQNQDEQYVKALENAIN